MNWAILLVVVLQVANLILLIVLVRRPVLETDPEIKALAQKLKTSTDALDSAVKSQKEK